MSSKASEHLDNLNKLTAESFFTHQAFLFHTIFSVEKIQTLSLGAASSKFQTLFKNSKDILAVS